MFYVNVSHLSDDQLEFLGYRVVAEDDLFKTYIFYDGSEHIVEKTHPCIWVEDMNDARLMKATSGIQIE